MISLLPLKVKAQFTEKNQLAVSFSFCLLKFNTKLKLYFPFDLINRRDFLFLKLFLVGGGCKTALPVQRSREHKKFSQIIFIKPSILGVRFGALCPNE